MSCKRSRRSGRLPGRSPPMAAVTWMAPRTAPPLCPGTWRLTRHTCSTTRSRWCRWVIIIIIPLSPVSIRVTLKLGYRILYPGHVCLSVSSHLMPDSAVGYLTQSIVFTHSIFISYTTFVYNCRFHVGRLSHMHLSILTRLTHTCPSNNTHLTCLSHLLHSFPRQ